MWEAGRERLGESVRNSSVLLVTILAVTASFGAGLGTVSATTAVDTWTSIASVSGNSPLGTESGNDGITPNSTSEPTLVTGDTVIIDDRSGETEYRLDGNTSAVTYETRTGTYVVPAHVNTTRFSTELFNVELLRGQNQTDAEASDVPLIVEWANASSMRTGLGPLSRIDVTRKRLLEMMNGSAVSVSKTNTSAIYRFLQVPTL